MNGEVSERVSVYCVVCTNVDGGLGFFFRNVLDAFDGWTGIQSD